MKTLSIVLVLFTHLIFGQTPKELVFPENAKIPENFKASITEQTSEFSRLFSRDSIEIKKYSIEFILDKVDTDKNYEYLFIAEYWIAFNYQKMIPELIKRINNKKEIGLENSADLIIWERIENKQMEFYGHGGISDDDLFTISGRANRLLKQITGENFGFVSMYSTQKELDELQNKWINWLQNLK